MASNRLIWSGRDGHRRGHAGKYLLAAIAIGVLVVGGIVGKKWMLPSGPVLSVEHVAPADDATGTYVLQDITRELGIDFVHEPGGPSFFFPEIVGSGVALFDYDCDGRLDIYFRSGTSEAPHPHPRPLNRKSRSRLFHQEPDGRFSDVTDQSGLSDTGYGMGVAIGDVNNDGYPDVYAVNFGGDRLYLNHRDGTFLDITASCGIANNLWGSSACFVDFDRDGRLDLFVTNYVDYSSPRSCTLSNGREDFCNPQEFPVTADKLYRNITDASESEDFATAVRFADWSTESGIASQSGPGLGVRACDANDDGWPDLFVANDGKPAFLWVNQHDGTFRDMAIPLGVAYNAVGKALAGMGIAEGDVDGDGHFDFLVTNIRAGSHALYRRTGSVFEDMAGIARLHALSAAHTGFGVALCDLDHDGSLDVALANGHVYQSLGRPVVRPPREDQWDSAQAARFWQAYSDTNQILMGDGQGKFMEVSDQTGAFAKEESIARGLAIGDLDNDGDLDLVLTNVAGPGRVYRNDFLKRGNWLGLRVIDPALGGRDAYGAVVTVVANDRRWIRRVQAGSSYQSSDDPRLHFGLGPVSQIEYIEVLWPNGSFTPERFDVDSLNSYYTLRRGMGSSQ